MAAVYYPDRLAGLLRAGAQFDTLGCDRTPLGIAVIEGLAQSCQILLEAGVDPNQARQFSFETPLCDLFDFRDMMITTSDGSKKPRISDAEMEAMASALVQHGADPNGICRKEDKVLVSECPLIIAARKRDIAGLKVLVRLGADINQACVMPERGNVITVMDYARGVRDENMMIELLRLGARLDSRRNLTPFQHCVECGYDKVVEYYVRECGESLTQRVSGHFGKNSLVDLAAEQSTKQLLLSLATELAIKEALGDQVEEGQEVLVPKKDRGMAL